MKPTTLSEFFDGLFFNSDIHTTMHVEDKASQHFNWLQGNVMLGVNFNYKKKQ